jgi:hypothetical protein
MAHSIVLITKRNAELQTVNKAASRRKSYKRKRVQQERTLTVEEGIQLTALMESKGRNDGKKAKKRARTDEGG